jgi:hypothetical protein
MLYYQPSQRLTWKYSAGTGQLTVFAAISVDLYSNEYISSAYTIVGDQILVTLNIESTGSTSPVIITADVDVISLNLSQNQVRDHIKAGIVYDVITTLYKNNKMEGEVINMTSSNANIEMAV